MHGGKDSDKEPAVWDWIIADITAVQGCADANDKFSKDIIYIYNVLWL